MNILRFNSKAAGYPGSAFLQKELAAWTAEWLPSAAQQVLELGAGCGFLTVDLVQRYSGVTATDEAPAMVELGSALVPQADWHCLDAWKPDGLDTQVDLLCSSGLLQWCPDPSGFFRTWRQYIRPGGRMLHGFFTAPTLSEWQSVSPVPPPLQWRSADAWQDAATQAGFVHCRFQTDCRKVTFANTRDLLSFVHKTGATENRRPVNPVALRRAINLYDQRFNCGSPSAQVYSTWTFCRMEAHYP